MRLLDKVLYRLYKVSPLAEIDTSYFSQYDYYLHVLHDIPMWEYFNTRLPESFYD
jgi:hypothetical protein